MANHLFISNTHSFLSHTVPNPLTYTKSPSFSSTYECTYPRSFFCPHTHTHSFSLSLPHSPLNTHKHTQCSVPDLAQTPAHKASEPSEHIWLLKVLLERPSVEPGPLAGNSHVRNGLVQNLSLGPMTITCMIPAPRGRSICMYLSPKSKVTLNSRGMAQKNVRALQSRTKSHVFSRYKSIHVQSALLNTFPSTKFSRNPALYKRSTWYSHIPITPQPGPTYSLRLIFQI